jgi:hypothetical protein
MLDGGSVLITEFMASNDATLQDFAGDHPDWIELHNPSAEPVDLAGFFLTDDATDLDRWQFPAAAVSILDPGEYLVVFASAKAGGPEVPATELHTNFKLSSDGEYLGLVMPDGATLVQEFAPEYPRQLSDISYGAGGAMAVPDSLLGAGAGARILLPSDGSLGAEWTGGVEPFDDSLWQAGAIGVGYDTSESTPSLYSLVDLGQTGQRVEPGSVAVGRTGNGVNLSATQLLSATGDRFTIAVDNRDAHGNPVGGLDWRDRGNGSDDPLVPLGEDHVKNNAGIVRVTLGSLPEGTYQVTSYHVDVSFTQSEAIWVFVADAVGSYIQQPVLASANLNVGGAGGLTTAEVERTSVTYTVVSNGRDDIVVLFDGTAANDTEVPLDGLRLDVLGGGYEGLIETDIEAMMLGQNGSAYVRIPLQVADPSEFTSLALDIHYDDGFVAYLNGVAIAARNAPTEPRFDSLATASQPLEQAIVPERIDVSAYLDRLVAGTNVLAIHGMNSSLTSGDFLILPALTASRSLVSPAAYYTTPTPGAANLPGALGIVTDTHFSVDRGFFDTPFQVEITTSTAGAEIRYTLDGSVPTATTGQVYADPIDIGATTILRAAAYQPGYLATDIDTQTYLFLDNVLQQSATFGKDGNGLPAYAAWGHAGSDWEVDPAITNAANLNNRLTTAELRSVPTLSLTLPWEDMFGGGGQGIYISGSGSPRAVSIEQILEDGSTGFQIDGSVQIQGGTSDNRWKSDKLSMRVKFTEAFGATKLKSPLFGDAAANRFDTLILDATLNHGWTHPSTGQTGTAKFIQDQFVANVQNAMGGHAPHARYHHVYINGLYWGMYYVHERPDESFAESYLGGDKDDYDVLKHTSGTVVNGSSANYRAMLDLTRQNLASATNFQNLAAVLDIDNLIDYMLINFYVGNEDWDHHNWYASYHREDADGRWRFHSWDAEHVLESVNRNVTGENTSGGPSGIHQRLTANAEYRQMFADHVQRHFFHGGVLTPDNAAVEYRKLMDEIDRAIVGESARWGDNRVSSPYTRDDWLDIQNGKLDDYFPRRTSIVLHQLRGQGLFPAASASAPEFEINGVPLHGGRITSGDLLGFSAVAGSVYYTTDGTDPRQPGGLTAATAQVYSVPLPVGTTTLVRARLRTAGGQWSPLSEARFFVNDPAGSENLAITEINYHPYAPMPEELATDPDLGRGDFEFIELMNIGSEPIDLTGVALTRGVQFVFADGPVWRLAAGDRLLVVKNQAAFETRYGTGRIVAGSYSGSLDDSGERLRLAAASGDLIEEFAYNDSGAWPGRADGKGSTLERIDSARDPDDAETWRNSSEYGGSPAVAGTGPRFDVIINEVLAHSDGASQDWIELLNRSGNPVDVSGWTLSDSSGNLQQVALPWGTTIGAGQYLVLTESQLGFALDGQQGDDVWLMEVDEGDGRLRRFADHWDFDATATDVSLGRWPNGDPAGTPFPMLHQTPGAANDGPLVGDVILAEVHYHPTWDRQEFVELYNTTAEAIDLDGWKLGGGVGLTFGPATILDPGGTLVLVGFDPADAARADAFRTQFDVSAAVHLVGPFAGALRNSGEKVKLLRPEDPSLPATGFIMVDQVHYDDSPPWVTAADGMGQSLTRTSAGAFAGLASSWVAAEPTPGEVAFALLGDVNRDGEVNGLDVDAFVDHLLGGVYQAEADMNGDGVVNGLDVDSFVDAILHGTALARSVTARHA